MMKLRAHLSASALLIFGLAGCGAAPGAEEEENAAQELRAWPRQSRPTPAPAASGSTATPTASAKPPASSASSAPSAAPTASAVSAPSAAPAASATPAASNEQSASCPNSPFSCVTADQNRLRCQDSAGRYSCVAPSGANVCPNGQVCPADTVCGSKAACNFETGICSYGCFKGGPIVVQDGAVGAPCQRVDEHGVTHLCSTNYCSAGAQPICLDLASARAPVSDG